MGVKERVMYEDDQGNLHPYQSWAEQANIRHDVIELLQSGMLSLSSRDAEDLLNWLDSHKKEVREYLDAGEKMMSDVMETVK